MRSHSTALQTLSHTEAGASQQVSPDAPAPTPEVLKPDDVKILHDVRGVSGVDGACSLLGL